jgi:hypothetical protein
MEEEPVPDPEDSLKSAKWLLIILVVCTALAFAAFFFVSSQKKAEETAFTYNYFKFQKQDGIWYTESQSGKNLYQIAMRYSPKELEDVNVTGDILGLKAKWGFFYITFDPTAQSFKDVTMANAEISTKLVQHFAIGLAPACTKPAQACEDMNVTIATCDNATIPVIFLNQAPGPLVEIRGNCAIVQGENDDIVRAADRFMYGMYGIMK